LELTTGVGNKRIRCMWVAWEIQSDNSVWQCCPHQ